jgi:hypothetical protein
MIYRCRDSYRMCARDKKTATTLFWNCRRMTNLGKYLARGRWRSRQKRSAATPNLERCDAKNGRHSTQEKSLTGPRILHYLWSYVLVFGVELAYNMACMTRIRSTMFYCMKTQARQDDFVGWVGEESWRMTHANIVMLDISFESGLQQSRVLLQ